MGVPKDYSIIATRRITTEVLIIESEKKQHEYDILIVLALSFRNNARRCYPLKLCAANNVQR